MPVLLLLLLLPPAPRGAKLFMCKANILGRTRAPSPAQFRGGPPLLIPPRCHVLPPERATLGGRAWLASPPPRSARMRQMGARKARSACARVKMAQLQMNISRNLFFLGL